MRGKVEAYLKDAIEEEGRIHLTLLDPEKVDQKTIGRVAKSLEAAGTTALMVGGSTATSVYQLDSVIRAVKRSAKIPVILFPNDVSGVSRYADAIFFMSLLNSNNPYYITGAQALGAPLVRKYGLEPISLAYLIVGNDGGTVGFIGRAQAIPFEKPEIASIYALAAEYLGMHFVYLEAGSGAKSNVPSAMIRRVREATSIPLIVGGGIRTPQKAREIARAGADAVVTGTLLERSSPAKIAQIIKAIRKAR